MTSCWVVFVRVVTEFTTESGEMFEILLGDTAFYYRFKESGEMFEIMLGDTAKALQCILP